MTGCHKQLVSDTSCLLHVQSGIVVGVRPLHFRFDYMSVCVCVCVVPGSDSKHPLARFMVGTYPIFPGVCGRSWYGLGFVGPQVQAFTRRVTWRATAAHQTRLCMVGMTLLSRQACTNRAHVHTGASNRAVHGMDIFVLNMTCLVDGVISGRCVVVIWFRFGCICMCTCIHITSQSCVQI